MDGIVTGLRANPGLLIVILLAVVGALVFGAVAAIMSRAGQSLRPVVFVAVFFAIVLLPQVLGQLVIAKRPVSTGAQGELAMAGGRFANPAALYGPDVDPSLIQDARAVFPDVFGGAEHAEMALAVTGETITAARFPTEEGAKAAAAGYFRLFRVDDTGGSEEAGWTGKRGVTGDRVAMRRAGRYLFIWTGPTRDAVAGRRSVSTAQIAGLAPATEPLWSGGQQLAAVFRPWWMKVGGVLLLMLVATVWFFKGTSWAAARPGAAGVAAVSADELEQRLRALGNAQRPVLIEPEGPSRLTITWRHGDPAVIELARTRRLRRTIRLRLRLDDAAKAVRVIEEQAIYNWASPGTPGSSHAALSWKATRGITFFEGVETSDGRRFGLTALKQPVIEVVTQSGWSWRPVMVDIPALQ